MVASAARRVYGGLVGFVRGTHRAVGEHARPDVATPSTCPEFKGVRQDGPGRASAGSWASGSEGSPDTGLVGPAHAFGDSRTGAGRGVACSCAVRDRGLAGARRLARHPGRVRPRLARVGVAGGAAAGHAFVVDRGARGGRRSGVACSLTGAGQVGAENRAPRRVAGVYRGHRAAGGRNGIRARRGCSCHSGWPGDVGHLRTKDWCTARRRALSRSVAEHADRTGEFPATLDQVLAAGRQVAAWHPGGVPRRGRWFALHAGGHRRRRTGRGRPATSRRWCAVARRARGRGPRPRCGRCISCSNT